jgi:hypothetical protein
MDGSLTADGTTSAGTITLAADGLTFTVSGNHTYASYGNLAGKVTISHGTSADVAATFTAAVSPALVLTGTNISSLDQPALQVLSSTMKVPALFFLTLLVTFPSLYVSNAMIEQPIPAHEEAMASTSKVSS